MFPSASLYRFSQEVHSNPQTYHIFQLMLPFKPTQLPPTQLPPTQLPPTQLNPNPHSPIQSSPTSSHPHQLNSRLKGAPYVTTRNAFTTFTAAGTPRKVASSVPRTHRTTQLRLRVGTSCMELLEKESSSPSLPSHSPTTLHDVPTTW